MTQLEAVASGLFWYVAYNGAVRTFELQASAEKDAFAECRFVLTMGPTSCSISVFKGATPVARVQLSNGDGWYVWSPAHYDVEVELTPEECAHIIRRRMEQNHGSSKE